MKSLERETRGLAVAVTAIFLIVAPGTVAVWAPWRMGGWQVRARFPWAAAWRVLGGSLVAAGALLLIEAFARFALKGMGTPAPIFPTKHLVVTGTYRFVRNPMYIAVVSLVLGQGLMFGDIRIVVYGLCVWLAMHLFVMVYEEPTLRKSFGDEYAEFCAHVPRWIPRLTAWKGQGRNGAG
jgi:protein-S-isoprenylcysteine O-methyltransferase Ste14